MKMRNYQFFFRIWSSKVVHQLRQYIILLSRLNSKQNALFPSLQEEALADRIFVDLEAIEKKDTK